MIFRLKAEDLVVFTLPRLTAENAKNAEQFVWAC